MRRSEIVLGSLLGIAIVVLSMGAISYWLLSQPAEAASADFANLEDLTAVEAYNLALPVALGWSGDAALLSARAGWQPQTDFLDGRASWNFVFYSPSQKATAVITVVNAKAQLVRTQLATGRIQIGDLSNWQMDSPAAIASLLQQGADDYMKMHAKVNLVLTLDTQNGPTWRSVFLDVDTKQSYSLNITADTGQFTP